MQRLWKCIETNGDYFEESQKGLAGGISFTRYMSRCSWFVETRQMTVRLKMKMRNGIQLKMKTEMEIQMDVRLRTQMERKMG
jgi:hypothetical protein